MAIRGTPRGALPGAVSTSSPPRPLEARPKPKPASNVDAAIADHPSILGRDSRRGLEGEGSGPVDPSSSEASEALGALGASSLADRLVFLLARHRKLTDRESALEHVARLVIGIERPELVQKALLTMGGPIVDIYPLELLARVATLRPDLAPRVRFDDFVRNRDVLEAARFFVEDPIRVDVPIALKMRAFALDGGGSPGYCFAPGAPGEYVLELAAPGRWPILLRGEIHKKVVIDRVRLWVEERPEDLA
ncbi:MAG: hypothetical protein HYV07_01035 [Deltaproteobacteria bacterium]|nr:hypothetical protein [Deltaproteobacteria bacterium]